MSIRESIINNVVEVLRESGKFKAVERTLPEGNDIRNVPTNLFPFVYVVGGLPVVEYPDWYNQTGTDQSVKDLESELEIQVTVFGNNGENPDTEISRHLEIIWLELNTDRSRGDHAQSTRLAPEPVILRQNPYFAVNIVVNTIYAHSYLEI